MYTNTNNDYIKTIYTTGGFIFCESYFLNEMPYDSTLDYLFTGEEILNSIKFFTNGWDIFVPKCNIIYHEYTRELKPKYWDDINITFDDRNALNKVRNYIYNKTKNIPYYNNYKLGTKRKLEDFYKIANINKPLTYTIYYKLCIFFLFVILAELTRIFFTSL